MGTTTERSFTADELKAQRGEVSAPEKIRQDLKSATESTVIHAALLAVAFSLIHVDFGFAAGAFLVIYGAKLLPIIVQVKLR